MAGIVGAFMAALDISIVNASLPQLQGEIGASGTEGAWIATSYLVAEIVIIPLTAWLVQILGLQRLLIGCTTLFVAFSVVSGAADTLTAMIIGRVGQGFFGGALIPTAMTIIALRLPPHQQTQGIAAFGMTVVLAPICGPLVGGWLTDNLSWRWLFFLNVPVGFLLVLMLLSALPSTRAKYEALADADWIGVIGLVFLLGGGTVVLEEGQREGWYDSPLITRLTVVAIAGSLMVLWSQLTRTHPVLKLSLLRERSLAGASLMSFVTGAAYYTIIYVLPLFLGTIRGFSAEQVGLVVMYIGAATLCVLPLIPVLNRKLGVRFVVGLGAIFLAISCFMDIDLTAQSGESEFMGSQLMRGLGFALVFFPLTEAAMAGISMDDAADASGLYNIARNIGGSVGLALNAVFIDMRSEYHIQQIGQSVTANSALAAQRLAEAAQAMQARGGDLMTAQDAAYRQLARLVEQQALVMTYADCFWVYGTAMLIALPVALLLKDPTASTPKMVH